MGRRRMQLSEAAPAVVLGIAVVSAAVTFTRGPLVGLLAGGLLVGLALVVVGLLPP